MWRARQLTLKGKITVLKTLVLSQMYYIASILYVPDEIIDKINRMIYKFLWPKKEHVK